MSLKGKKTFLIICLSCSETTEPKEPLGFRHPQCDFKERTSSEFREEDVLNFTALLEIEVLSFATITRFIVENQKYEV